ncbi:MAG: thioredoxin-disulfide reductase [Acidobacteria bacterium]|jgi:thioredoxin reductase (NADPH)|nr:thioredoxin-disulfide reductase [Acidobacteriota bacterium]
MAERVVIIGSGPAGHTAAIYTGRAGLRPLVIEGFSAGGPAGGQLMATTEVENFPGFPEGVTGPALMERMRAQSEKCGARFRAEDVDKADLSSRPFKLWLGDEVVEARSLIIATGATARRLNLPSEPRLWNRGISACAVCDGALPVFRNRVLVVVGGGDTAMEEALYLTNFASKVLLVHRRGEFRASKAMQQRVIGNPKIMVLWNSAVVDAVGETGLRGVIIRHLPDGKERTVEAAGLFYAIGHTPNTAIFKGQIELDETGYIITKERSTRTSVEGVFAAGDVQDKVYRQAISAAGTGCMAALDCERWLSAQE